MTRETEHQYQMTMTHEDFTRQLADLFEGVPYEVSGNDITARWPDRSLKIHLSPQRELEMGSLDLPSMTATFDFEGFSEEERLKFLERVQQHYQGAGGP